MRHLFMALVLALLWPLAGWTQGAAPTGLAELLAANRDLLERPARATTGPFLEALIATGDPAVPGLVRAWADRRLHLRAADGAPFLENPDGSFAHALSGAPPAPDDALEQLRPGGSARAVMAAALVRFDLTDPDTARRRSAVE
ncbi:MAG: urea ABC transporter permease subunit UrtB, partial [Rhodobacteraceae bacterium]|nr:urea ABC transporter permease subunit UrtB [Paracoccaceae bacterium]